MIDALHLHATLRAPKALRRAIALLKAGLHSEADRQRRQQAAAQLRSVSDHSLKDIGLHRSEIESVTNGIGLDQDRRRNGQS